MARGALPFWGARSPARANTTVQQPYKSYSSNNSESLTENAFASWSKAFSDGLREPASIPAT